MDPEGEKLLQRFRARKRLTGSQLKTQIPLARELVAAGEVVELDAFYLAGTEPTIDTERSRIEAKTLKQAKLFAPASLLPRHRSLKALVSARSTKATGPRRPPNSAPRQSNTGDASVSTSRSSHEILRSGSAP
jgi:hypothetical protein